MIDLHLHSTASDGTLSPSELVTEARRLELSAVALTDHDTVSGLPEFMAAGRRFGVETVPGVEIACSWYGFSLHLTGLFIDYDNSQLQSLLTQVRQAREHRNRQILAELNRQGVNLSLEEVTAESSGRGGYVIGRPHFAQALVRGRHCADLQQAFKRYLGRGGKAYVRRFLPLPRAAIESIHGAGGVAILAHPFGGTDEVPRARMRQKLQRLIPAGLDGLEAYYCDYTPEQEQAARQLAGELDLLVSGGSDFHGGNSPGNRLGCGYGGLKVPEELLEPLRQRARRYREKPSKTA